MNMKNIKMKEISILPHRSLMPKLGQTGYSVSQAIAELVDNSIDARREGELLTVEIILDSSRNFVEVVDNGVGMDEEAAANSIRLAHSSKVGQLGEFGLGLKTAATSLGKVFQVITTQRGSDEEYALEYDEDQWLKSGDWTRHQMKIKSGANKKFSSTTIKIKNLKFKIYPNLPGKIREDLSIRFAPYIENGEVDIRVNKKWCEPKPLELKTDYYPPDGKEPFRKKIESGNEVWGWRGLLKRGSDKGEYGFRVFRRGRLIMQHAKVGFNPHPEARQITGELHLDHIPVTHNKREFIQESPFWQEINEPDGVFWNFMRDLVREARSSVRTSQISQAVLDQMEIQKENIMKAIKTLPELKEYAFPDLREKIKAGEGEFGEVEIEKRDPREMISVVDDQEPADAKERRAKKTHIRRSYYITVNGKKFKVVHSFVDLKTDNVMKDKSVDEENGIHIFTNVSFPAYANTKDYVFYGAWHIAEAVAEVMVAENKRPYEEVVKIRDLILKKSAEITRDLDQVEKEKKMAERLKREYEEKIVKIKEIEGRHIDVRT